LQFRSQAFVTKMVGYSLPKFQNRRPRTDGLVQFQKSDILK